MHAPYTCIAMCTTASITGLRSKCAQSLPTKNKLLSFNFFFFILVPGVVRAIKRGSLIKSEALNVSFHGARWKP